MNLHFSLPAAALTAVFILSACQTTPTEVAQSDDACGASQYHHLVGGPSRATTDLDVPGNSRHYGIEELVTTDFSPARLNFVHSGTAIEAVIAPGSTVVRIYCG